MRWIEKVSRDSKGRIEFVARMQGGQAERLRPRAFPHNFAGSEKKLFLTVSSQAHRVTTVDDYLEARGWDLVGDAQRLHRFDTEQGCVWIPSQLMFKFVFGPFLDFYDLLFTSRSIHELAVTGAGSAPELLPGWIGSNKSWRPSELQHSRLFWLMNSRSASICWGQVFRSALDGVLDVKLPDGTFDVSVTGKRCGDEILASDVRLQRVISSDLHLPDGEALPPQEFTVHHSTGMEVRRAKRGVLGGSIQNIETWKLGDPHYSRMVEWLSGSGFLNSERYQGPLGARLRRDLDLLRAKHMVPCEWNSLPCTKQELACAQSRLYKIRRRGALEPFHKMLLSPTSAQ